MDVKNYHKLTLDNVCCMSTREKVFKSKTKFKFY
jgi:hypothetical protein